MRAVAFLLGLWPLMALAQTASLTGGSVGGVSITGITAMTTPPLAASDNSASAVSSAWVKQLFPGLGVNVQGSGVPGQDVSGCSTLAACGIFDYSAPGNVTAAATPLLRLQRVSSYSGGTAGEPVKTLWVLDYTSPHGSYYDWPLTSQMYNETPASLATQNVAINGTAFKQFPSGSTAPIGATWGGNFVCSDLTGVVNPAASCIGAEVDSYAVAGSGTDANRQRVGLQIALGPNTTDTGVHFGRALLIGAGNGGIIDNAIEVDMSGGANSFLVNGNGATTITSGAGTWSRYNVGKQLIVTTPAGATNPGIGISDLNQSNFWDVANYAGDLQIQAMPALSDSTTTPVTAVSFPRNGVGGMQLPVVKVAALPACASGAEGTVLGVSDAKTATFNAVLAGGGSVHIMAYCNGTSWVAQ